MSRKVTGFAVFVVVENKNFCLYSTDSGAVKYRRFCDTTFVLGTKINQPGFYRSPSYTT